MKHGVIRLEDGTYDFYWFGQRMSLEEFNEQTHATASSLKDEVDAISQGMDIAALCQDARIRAVELENLERLAKLPLCDHCRKLIGC